MITKDSLVIGGYNKISIININEYNLVREIDIPKSNIFGFCGITENIFLTGDNNGTIIQWAIEGNNIFIFFNQIVLPFLLEAFLASFKVTIISKKKAHSESI